MNERDRSVINILKHRLHESTITNHWNLPNNNERFRSIMYKIMEEPYQ